MVTASNAATAAENRPVCICYVILKSVEGTTKTYEDKHALGITFPTFRHLYVLFFGQIEIHSEQSPRTIGEVGLSRLGFLLGLGSI